jgi:hypothetical protein
MTEWDRKEADLQRKENAWYEKLSPFMKMVDNPVLYYAMLLIGCIFGFGLGTLIGVML